MTSEHFDAATRGAAPGAAHAAPAATGLAWHAPGTTHGATATADRRWQRGVAVAVLGLVVLYAAAVPLLAARFGWWGGVDQNAVDYTGGLTGPTLAHPFGTDVAGRDLFVRSAQALRVSLLAAVLGAGAATVVGGTIGATIALVGGRVDQVASRTIDAFTAVPHLLLGIVIASIWRGSLWTVVLVVAATHWNHTARLTRAHVLTLKERAWVRTALSQGYTRPQVLRHHVGGHVLSQVTIAGALLVPHAIWHETTLTFLGLGLAPHQPSLGSLINLAQQSVFAGAWWTLAVPVALLVVATISLAATLRRKDPHVV